MRPGKCVAKTLIISSKALETGPYSCYDNRRTFSADKYSLLI